MKNAKNSEWNFGKKSFELLFSLIFIKHYELETNEYFIQQINLTKLTMTKLKLSGFHWRAFVVCLQIWLEGQNGDERMSSPGLIHYVETNLDYFFWFSIYRHIHPFLFISNMLIGFPCISFVTGFLCKCAQFVVVGCLHVSMDNCYMDFWNDAMQNEQWFYYLCW